MAKRALWHDDYWLLLMQLYLKKPQGAKALYSRGLVSLAIELHIPPKWLYMQMLRLRQIDTPSMQQLWDTYANRPRKLKKEAELVRQMKGFGNFDEFYAGVEVNETWEKDFKPIFPERGEGSISPVMLIMILDLYFRLIPDTMVPQTPEIVELSRLMGISPDEVTQAMEAFRRLDPQLGYANAKPNTLAEACKEIWQRYGNEMPDKLAAKAAQLKDYWR